MKSIIKYSIVVPVFNEEAVLEDFYKRTIKSLSQTDSFEIIFINDGSTDNTPLKLKELSRKEKRIKIISFSRNFGHSAAISAGLKYTKGEAVVIIDADLQDPPELLTNFFEKWQEGYSVVYGVRKKRKEGLFKRLGYWFFYRLLYGVSSLEIPLDAGDFCLLDRKVVDIINALPERNRFLRGLRSWAGFSQYGLSYERDRRFLGKTKYSFKKLLHLAADGIFSFSYVPLRIATILGFVIAGVSFLAILFVLYLRIFVNSLTVSGFTSTIVIILFLGGIQLMTVGILGEYVARIYEEVKQRPLYVIKEKLGFKE